MSDQSFKRPFLNDSAPCPPSDRGLGEDRQPEGDRRGQARRQTHRPGRRTVFAGRGSLMMLGAVLVLALSPVAYAAQESAESEEASAVQAEADEKPDKNLKFSFIGGPFYNSRVQLAIGAAPLLTFSTDPDDSELQRSTVVFPLSISTNRSFAIATAARVFFPADRMRGTGMLVLKTGPNLYYGRGYESASDPANEEQYDGREFRFAWTQQWRLREDLYLGGGFDVKYDEASNFPEDGLIANEANPPEVFNSGLAMVASYDSRDVAGNAYEGMLFEVDTRVFRKWLGGDADYEQLRIDYRGYKKISATRNFAIAWQALTERAWNGAPWQELPALGSPREMRAYFQDRYRDEWRILGQFEVRLHEIKGRIGMAAWIAAGTVAPSLSRASIEGTLVEIGIGMRYRMQPRQNARIDLAFGRGSYGFVLNVQEAF